jgi:hypothetical protein
MQGNATVGWPTQHAHLKFIIAWLSCYMHSTCTADARTCMTLPGASGQPTRVCMCSFAALQLLCRQGHVANCQGHSPTVSQQLVRQLFLYMNNMHPQQPRQPRGSLQRRIRDKKPCCQHHSPCSCLVWLGNWNWVHVPGLPNSTAKPFSPASCAHSSLTQQVSYPKAATATGCPAADGS